MNLPNKLSLARIAMIPAFLGLMLWGGPNPDNPTVAAWMRAGALVIVIAAAITDWLDGKIARARNLKTNLGALLDPLADKLLVASAFVAFVELQLFPSWLIIVILCREFLVTGLRTLAAVHGQVMAADTWGKHKTGWQLATIITAMVYLSAREFLRAAGLWDDPLFGTWRAEDLSLVLLHALLVVAVVLTLLSGWLYVWKNKGLLKE